MANRGGQEATTSRCREETYGTDNDRASCTTPTVDEHALDQLAELLKEKLETPSGDPPHVHTLRGVVGRRRLVGLTQMTHGDRISHTVGAEELTVDGDGVEEEADLDRIPRLPGVLCDSWEHLQFNCPYRTHCHRCLQPGHIAKHCEATTPARARRGGSIATLTTEVRGLILTDLQIRRKTYPFLVDTGADVSLIPTSIASELGLAI